MHQNTLTFLPCFSLGLTKSSTMAKNKVSYYRFFFNFKGEEYEEKCGCKDDFIKNKSIYK